MALSFMWLVGKKKLVPLGSAFLFDLLPCRMFWTAQIGAVKMHQGDEHILLTKKAKHPYARLGITAADFPHLLLWWMKAAHVCRAVFAKRMLRHADQLSFGEFIQICPQPRDPDCLFRHGIHQFPKKRVRHKYMPHCHRTRMQRRQVVQPPIVTAHVYQIMY